MNRTFYEKINGEFVPTCLWDAIDESVPTPTWNAISNQSLESGAWLVVVKPGTKITQKAVDIDWAPLQAAGILAQDNIAQAIYNESRKNVPTKSSGASATTINSYDVFPYNMTRSQAQHIAEAGIQAMQDQAQELLSNPSVRAAYDQFMLICKLAK